METNIILEGDCLQELKDLPNESVDSIVTDPPYGLKFMGKSWDYDVPSVEIWKECFRVLKSGGHLLSFSGTRTYHRMACAIEDAGFEVRDMIEWVYGSGFPKSLNIGKALDKQLGATRNRIQVPEAAKNSVDYGKYSEEIDDNNPITDEAKEWEGWGTALKPAHEPIVMARKPLSEKTVADNVLKFGTGGINIDESRIGTTDNLNGGGYSGNTEFIVNPNEIFGERRKQTPEDFKQPLGRFPANLIHDGSPEVLAEFEKAGNCGAFAPVKSGQKGFGGVIYGKYETGGDDGKTFYKDGLGTPARFFKTCEFTEEDFEYAPFVYFPKASKSERNMGIEGYELKENIPEDIKSLIYKQIKEEKEVYAHLKRAIQ